MISPKGCVYVGAYVLTIVAVVALASGLFNLYWNYLMTFIGATPITYLQSCFATVGAFGIVKVIADLSGKVFRKK